MEVKVSVIIPVLNETKSIVRLLGQLIFQTRLPDEIVITDGGSTDRTQDKIKLFIDKGYPIRLIHFDGAWPGKGRNLAVMESKHDIIVFVDAGVKINNRWLSSLLEPLEADPTVDVVFGHYEPQDDGFFTRCAAMAYIPPSGKDGIRKGVIFGCAMRKEVWEKVGGFPDYRASEDLIFIERIKAGAFNIVYTKDAVSHLKLRPTWRQTYRRFAEYSRHNLRSGRERYWHWPTLRIYALGAAILGLATQSLPLALIVVLGGIYRTLKRMYPDNPPRSLKTVLTVSGIIHMIDVATLHGFLVWVFVDRCRKGEGRW